MLVYEIKAMGVALVLTGRKVNTLRIEKSLDNIFNFENIYSNPDTIKVPCNAVASDNSVTF